MNPTQTNNPVVNSPESLLEKAFENNEFAQPNIPPIDDEDLVVHSDEHRRSFKNDWVEFMSLTSESPVSKSEVNQTIMESLKTVEVTEAPASKLEVQQMFIKEEFKPHSTENAQKEISVTATSVIKKQKGSGSSWSESGLKILPDYKDIGKSAVGGLGVLWEIVTDTTDLLVKAFTEKFLTPEEIKKNAEKKAEQKKKNSRIQAFYDKMAAQAASIVTVEAVRMESTEKENINKTIKLTNTSYKGIKDSFGRMTVYAASMFEREQLEQDKQMKKIEKQQKMASAKGPDLNLDKAAEGGFLSSTGGQGAG